ncbi:unnamed protein product [Colias eurytheme]|nr:unnamed protein product [Colias eurytheme]
MTYCLRRYTNYRLLATRADQPRGTSRHFCRPGTSTPLKQKESHKFPFYGATLGRVGRRRRPPVPAARGRPGAGPSALRPLNNYNTTIQYSGAIYSQNPRTITKLLVLLTRWRSEESAISFI